MAPMAVVGAQGAKYVESDEMLLRVCSGKSLSLAKVVEAAACDAASGTYTDDQGRLALHHACAHDQVTVEILAATPGDRFAKDISGDAPVDLLCRNPAATAAAHSSCLAGRDDRVAADYGSLLHYWALCACATPHLLAAAAARSPADRDARGLTPLHCLCSNRAARAAAFDADGADGRRRRRELRDDGFTVVRVGERAAAELARETSAVLDHCLAAPDLDVFGTIRTPDNRYDVKAALTPKLRAVLADLAADLPWLAAAPVTQLSAVHSDPGAPLQTPHSDTCFIRDDAPRLYTALVALTPVSQERGPVHGPTAVWPGTHGADFHALSDADRLARLRDGRQLAICPLKPGEGILFDARLFHRGGRNATAADRRSLLSVSLQAAAAWRRRRPRGTTDSIFAAYRDKYRLGDFAAAEA
ncbi:phytanoyl-CoA dioxygenase [Aureococcus anophagefferens]|nr:phytanoyl-CoA dioxygenase [Aureococcus anophagefferens]